MKKYIKYLYIIIPVVILVIVLFYFFDNKTEKNMPVVEGTKDKAIIQTDTEAISPTDAYISFGLTLAQSSPDVGYPTGLKQYPNLTWEEKNIKINSNPRDYDNIGIQYPQFIGGSIVKKLNEYIYSLIETAINDDREMIATGGSFDNSVRLSAGYNVVGVYNGIVSVEVVMTDFTGGGNGNHDVSFPINWDLKSDRLLKPNDIFCSKDWISKLMPTARKVLLQYYDQNLVSPNNPYTAISREFISDGTSSDPSNWQHLLLSDMVEKKGVTVVFQPYQVFSGASGITKVFISDSASHPFLCLP